MRQSDAEVDSAIETMVTTMKQVFHHELGVDGEPRPMFALLCTVDPKTGQPFKSPTGMSIVFVIGDFANDDDKDRIAMTVRMLAVAGAAVASVFTSDTWVLRDENAQEWERRGILPSQSKHREEALCCIIERLGRKPRMEHHVYKRLDDDIQFEDCIPRETEVAGRFAHLIPQDPLPARVVEMTRSLVAMGALGTLEWKPL